jgi:serpin B
VLKPEYCDAAVIGPQGKSPPPAPRIEPLEARTLFSAASVTAAEQAVAQANNAFAFDLLHQLSPDQSGNTFFSPYSADTALEMALQGAKGTTASEMIQALHLPASDVAQAGISALYQLFQAAPANAAYTLSSANRLWVNNNFPLLQSFITSSQNTFGAGPQTVNFADPPTAVATINSWVSNETHGKITNLIAPDQVSALTRLVLTNAVYFQGNWASEFDPTKTAQSAFQISSTQAATVSMMNQTSDYGYYAQGGADGFQAVDLPYAGGNLDMLVILPTTYDLAGFESTMTSSMFSQITSSLTQANLDLSLPKFQMNESYNLNGALQNLGIQMAFGPSADFSGMSTTPTNISFVVQKTYVNVDETGTTAAAATGIGIAALVATYQPPPITFDANHPFLFAIRDNATNTILFLGGTSDPSNGTADYSTATAPPISSPPTTTTTTGAPPVQIASGAPPTISGVSASVLNGKASRKVALKISNLSVVSHAKNLADLSGTVSWGDGSTSPVHFVRVGKDSIAIRGAHAYAEGGAYPITISTTQTPYANGKPTGAASAELTPLINTEALISPHPAKLPPMLKIAETTNVPFTATLATIDLPALPAAVTRSATIHWADGSQSAGTLTANGAAFDITATHTYTSAGEFHVVVDVWQKGHRKTWTLRQVKATIDVAGNE